MQRSEQQRISAEAERHFGSIVSGEHALRKQDQDDNGIDYEIELFREGQTTGFIFKVQLKGTENLHLLTDGNRISFNGFELPKAKYLIEEIEIPAAIILVDVITKQTYWTSVQDNNPLIGAYEAAKKANRGEITVHLNTQNVLPETWDTLFGSMVRSVDFLALRRASTVPPPRYSDYVEKIKNLKDLDWELIQLNQKGDISRIEKLQRLIRANQLKEADSLVYTILQSNDRSIEAKFEAIIRYEQITVRAHSEQMAGFGKAKFDLWQANQLQELCNSQKNVAPRLKRLADGYTLIANLHYLVVKDYQLYLTSVQQRIAVEQGTGFTEPYWYHLLPNERTELAKVIIEVLAEATEYIDNLLSDEYWQFVPEFLTRTIWIIVTLLRRLKGEGLIEGAKSIEDWLYGALDFAVQLTSILSSEEQIRVVHHRYFILHLILLLAFHDDPERKNMIHARAKDIITQLENNNTKTEYQKKLDEALAQSQSLITEERDLTNSPINWKILEDHFRNQAEALGFDLSLADVELNQDDEQYWNAQIAQVISIGIKDLNPTRVLKNCQHLVFEYWGGIGRPAQMMGLYSARMKIVGCVNHPTYSSWAAFSLDDSYSNLFEKYCENCSDSDPHPNEWDYTEAWHKKQLEKWDKARE
jgi:hypothetical protein